MSTDPVSVVKWFPFAGAAFVVLGACNQFARESGDGPATASAVTAAPLPAHWVASNEVIRPATGARRIQLHVDNAALTRDECLALLARYAPEAADDGQVSVRKPAPDGQLQPWCVDNRDGKPAFFNDYVFAVQPAAPRPLASVSIGERPSDSQVRIWCELQVAEFLGQRDPGATWQYVEEEHRLRRMAGDSSVVVGTLRVRWSPGNPGQLPARSRYRCTVREPQQLAIVALLNTDGSPRE